MVAESSFEQMLKRTGEREQLWHKGDVLLVAVSGGPDSMALLHALHRLSHELDLTVTAAHLNHGFRQESEIEAVGVAAFAESLGIRCELGKVDMPAIIKASGLNAQAAARMKRYEFLHAAAERMNASSIAFAHHADDQAETVMMRLLRGTSIGGLSGIPLRRREKKVELIRPLLRMYKIDILQYCREYEIPYYEDSSNSKRDYFRNEIRLDVLPFLECYNERLPQSLSRLAELASAEDDYMQADTASVFTSIVTMKENQYEVDVSAFVKLHVALQRRLIKLILTYLVSDIESIPFERIETMRAAFLADAPSTWRTDAGSGVLFLREYGKVIFEGKGLQSNGNAYFLYEAPKSGDLIIAESGQRFQFELIHAGQVAARSLSSEEALFDADAVLFPLHMRNRRPGDRMKILGLNGTKKVQDMFVDAKIAPSLRDRLALLVDGNGELLWVPGIRRSAHALITEQTRSWLRITLKVTGEAGSQVIGT